MKYEEADVDRLLAILKKMVMIKCCFNVGNIENSLYCGMQSKYIFYLT